MDSPLEEQLNKNRLKEMDAYGRSAIYPKMRNLLEEKQGKILDLINHGLALVDDELDNSTNPLEQLQYIQQLFKQSYVQTYVHATTPLEQTVVDLGLILQTLSAQPFYHLADRALGKNTYQDVLEYWMIEEKNMQRKNKILDKETLDELNTGIGALVASQFLYILDSPRVYHEFTQLSKVYGLAVKLADNLCDFKEDIQKGFINIPKEEIQHVRGILVEDDVVMHIDPEKLALSAEYMQKEQKNIEELFASADMLMLLARARRPLWSRKTDEKLVLFKQFCHSWLDQARAFTLQS